MKYFLTLVWLASVLPLGAADYATYIGDAYAYTVNALTVDSSGNTYLTGSRAIVTSVAGFTSNDVFVTKVDPSGNVTLLATLSGKGSDVGNGIAVDSSGDIYVAGSTTSPDFPVLGALQTAGSSTGTGFLTKLSGAGTILYSTYLGGAAGSSRLNAVTVDSAGDAYVTGETFASDYPHTSGLPNASVFDTVAGISAAFFAKVSPNGDKLIYAGGIAASGHACGMGSSCFTSLLSTFGASIAVDRAGNAYVAGNTNGIGLPATAGALETSGLGAFIFKINAAGTGIGYLTLLGSANYFPPPVATNSGPGNYVTAIAADAVGDAYITGWTSDPNFPATPGAYQSQPAFTVPLNNPYSGRPASDAFAAKINPSGTAMVWATFLGGSATDAGTTIALDASDDVWITGTTQSADFPASAGFPGGNEFLVELNPAGTALDYAARYPTGSAQAGLAIDGSGAAEIAGSSGLVSAVTPSNSTPRLFGLANAAAGSLTGRLAPAEAISIYGLHLGVPAPVSASVTYGYLPVTLGGIQVTIGGVAAPLLYVSDTQINAIVPQGLAINSTPTLQVSTGAAALPGFRTVVDQAIPGIFLLPNGTAAALNQDGTVNSAANAAHGGTLVSIWGTGVDYSSGADGQIVTAAQQGCSCDVFNEELIVPAYAGAAPGMPSGIVQVNFQVPAGGAPTVGYYLTVDGKNSNVFTIYVAQ